MGMVDPWSEMGSGKPAPVSVPVKTYHWGASKTPKKLTSFPALYGRENCDALVPLRCLHFRILCLLKIFAVESLS